MILKETKPKKKLLWHHHPLLRDPKFSELFQQKLVEILKYGRGTRWKALIQVAAPLGSQLGFPSAHISSGNQQLSLHKPLIPGWKIPIICPGQDTLLRDYVCSR